MSADGPDTPEAIRRREELADTVTELENLVEEQPSYDASDDSSGGESTDPVSD